MNKINNKGFMMAEIIVVAVVIVIALVGLFTTFTKTFIEYERLNEYSQVDSLYASKSVINTLYSDIDSAKEALKKAEEDDPTNKPKFIKHDKTTDSKLEPLFEKYNIKTFYLVEYSNEGFSSLIGSLTNNEELKRYVNYLKNNLDLTDTNCKVISILEMQSDSSSTKNQFGYYKFVKTTTGGGTGGGGGVIYNPPNKPDIENTGLVPIKYIEESGKWQVTTENDEEWYDYNEQKWANAALVKEGVITEENSKPILTIPDGSTIYEDSSDVLAMFVWIPRYSYTIGCTSVSSCYGYRMNDDSDKDSGNPSQSFPGAIDIKFISEDAPNETYTDDSPTYLYSIDENGMPQEGRNPQNWYTHPAFTFGDDELSGIWVGKFETSVTSSGYNACSIYLNSKNTSASSSCKSTKTYLMPRILPNVLSLVYQNVYDQFETAKKFTNDVYGLSDNIDSHMMKNSEWAAVAYLSQSIYGKYGNPNYKGKNKEIYRNDSGEDSWARYTGRSFGDLTSGYSNKGNYKYDDISTADGKKVPYSGTGASTTGNIYGIYDMNGGADERVMGNYNDNNTYTKSGFDDEWFTTDGNNKYYNKFTTKEPNNNKTDDTIGYAFVETKNWYDDNTTTYYYDSNPWVIRGGSFNHESNDEGIYSSSIDGGIFSSNYNVGSAASNHSFRSVLLKKS